MPRTSCLPHQPRARVVLLREDFLELCENKPAPAILLALIEHATNFRLELIERLATENEARAKDGLEPKKADEWIYHSRDEWIAESLGLLKLHDIKDAFSYLEQRGFIERRRHPDHKWSATWQVKLDIEATANAILELSGGQPATAAAEIYDRTNGNRQPHERKPVTAHNKDISDSYADYSADQSTAAPDGGRPSQPHVAYFEQRYEEVYALAYKRHRQDFIHLAALKKRLDQKLTPKLWKQACKNYFKTLQGSHTLADLCTRFDTFQLHSLDRYGKPEQVAKTTKAKFVPAP